MFSMLALPALLGAITLGGGGVLGLILTIAIIGVVVWLITTYLPMPPVFKTVIWVIAVILLIVVLVNALGGGGIY